MITETAQPGATAAPNLANLTDAFTEARKAGEAADTGEDGGTCNFDSAAIRLPGVRASLMDAAASAALVSVRKLSGKFWQGYWLVSLPYSTGQGNRRTRVAEAMERALLAAGFETTVYYQMD